MDLVTRTRAAGWQTGIVVDVRVSTERTQYTTGESAVVSIENRGTTRVQSGNWTCGSLHFEQETADGWLDTGLPVLVFNGRRVCQPVLFIVEPGATHDQRVLVQVGPGRYRLAYRFGAVGVEAEQTVYSDPYLVTADPTPEPPVRTSARLMCDGPESVTPPGARLRVQLTDEAGTPLAGWELHWERRGNGGGTFIATTVRTDEAGLATVQDIVPFDAGINRTEAVVVSFQGDDTHEPADCTVAFHARSAPLPTRSVSHR